MLTDEQHDPLHVHTPGPEPSGLRTGLTIAAAGTGVLFVAWMGYLAFIGVFG